jgi:hypothetical protein
LRFFETQWRTPVARPESTGQKVFGAAERNAYTVREFCDSHRISRAHYYNIRKLGQGPDEARVGDRVIITIEAAARWRRQREKATRA